MLRIPARTLHNRSKYPIKIQYDNQCIIMNPHCQVQERELKGVVALKKAGRKISLLPGNIRIGIFLFTR